ncbi:MAG: iron-containing redox enzyme family protein [Polyangiaceae bacterium]|jgi:pyrroloquinoline quinone (PQQ) biosynthesis protein C
MRSAIAAIKARVDPLGTSPYFRTLRDGSMTKEQFVATQIQFFHAVIFFSRPMAALVGRIPRPQMRVALLENLGDEHGSGRLTVCHENTFLELLARLGVDRPHVDRCALWPEVRAFNAALLGACAHDDVYTGLAALGIIEDVFAAISAEIGQAIAARGWLKRREIVHYATHAELDVAHAEGFYASLYEPYERHPRWRYQIDQGLELGAYVFARLYDDLWRARDRTWTRDVLGPHTLSDGAWLDGMGDR